MHLRRAAFLAILLVGTAPAAFAQPLPDKEVSPLPPVPLTVPLPPAPPTVPAPVAVRQVSPTIESGRFLSREYWWICDGYSPPSSRQDGLGAARNMPQDAGNSRAHSALGRGVAVCDAALADPRLQPQMTIRRASLLQARAMHKAQSGDRAGALADLTEADALLGTDGYGRRSVGAGSQLIRAWTQLRNGERDAAAQTARAAIALRPFEPSYRAAAARIHLAATDDWERFITDSRELAVIDPNRLMQVFAILTMRGDWEGAAALYPQIVLTTPRNRGGYAIENLTERSAEQLRVQATLHGTYAYSFAARGMPAEAEREIAAARAAIDEAARPPQPLGQRTELTRAQRDTHQAVLGAATQARQAIDRYAMLVELRGKADAQHFQSTFTRLLEERPGLDGTTLDLVRALARVAPGDATMLTQLVGVMEAAIARTMNDIRDVGLNDIFEAMPEPETLAGLPAYDGGSDGFLSLDHNGYRLHEGVTPGTQTVRFASTRGSLSTASEMVLLRAAELARAGGHRGLVLVARRGLIRQLITVGIGGGTTPSGQEAEVDIRFVDPANLPPEYAAAPWRVIDPEQVWSALQPVYAPARRSDRN